MQFPISFSGASAVTTNVGGSNNAVAAAEGRRRRMLKMKRSRRRDHSGFVPPPLPDNINNQGTLMYLFCKRLQPSDVNNIGRIVLPKRLAETHLPRLSERQSIYLPVFDMDGGVAWSFKYRYWPNNLSRMYVLEGTGPFTRKYGLQTGDYMLVYKDMSTWTCMIRAVKASEVEGCANKELTVTEGNNTDKVILNDAAAENDDAAEVGTLDLLDFPDNFFEMESLAENGDATEVGTLDLLDFSDNFFEMESLIENDAAVKNDDAAEVGTLDLLDFSDNFFKMECLAENGVAVKNDDAAEVGALDHPDVSDNFSKTESLVGTSSMNDDDIYYSDILNSFSSWDEIKDFYYSP